jgi:8-oxo-dGTP diphosphatase
VIEGMVVGFLFTDGGKYVVLIRKRRPDWMAGRLNGPGGKINPDETPDEAMRREYVEETGLGVLWRGPYLTLTTDHDTLVHFYAARSTAAVEAVRTTTDEEVVRRDVGTLHVGDCLPNLAWLVALAWYHLTHGPIHAYAREGAP